MVSWSILRQIIDWQDTDKSRYFVISKFNHFLAPQGNDQPFFSRERGSNYTLAEYYLQQNMFRQYHEWADHYLQVVICRSCGGLLANGKKENNASNDSKIYCYLLPGTETTGKVTMMITSVTRSTIQGTVIVITTGAVGIALALTLHLVSTVIVVYMAPILHCRFTLEVASLNRQY